MKPIEVSRGFSMKKSGEHPLYTKKSHNAGFNLIEVMFVVLGVAIVSGIALMNLGAVIPGIRADAALNQTVSQLRRGRELAIAQRRRIQLGFTGSNQIQLLQQQLATGIYTVINTVTLEHGSTFQVFSDVPDTPDLLGKAAPVFFSGGGGPYTFLPDGTLVDSQGTPRNCSVFLGQNNNSDTARAATLMGSTGRIRGYRWIKSQNKWAQ
jgi:Tfp pilus assembly protein FimT